MGEEALLQHRIVFLAGPITVEVANRVVAQLLLLDADNPRERIDLYINSPGGSITDGLAIIDAVRCLQAPVSTICIGCASSMAAWILAAGTPGYRYATPNAEIMIHQAAATIGGQTSDIQTFTQRLSRLQERLINLLAEWTGQPSERIRQDIEREFFMSAEEAKAYGIIDALLEPVPKTRL